MLRLPASRTLGYAMGLCLAFTVGLCCGVLFISPATAQQQPAVRGTQDARENFLQGGNTQVAVLREILRAAQEANTRLEAIERNTAASAQGQASRRPAAQ